jgi:hypothetical protein
MLGMRHPFTHSLYERNEDGTIVVTELPDRGGRSGRFTRDGRWIDGELRECDPHLCGWVAGPIIGNHRMVETAPKHESDRSKGDA